MDWPVALTLVHLQHKHQQEQQQQQQHQKQQQQLQQAPGSLPRNSSSGSSVASARRQGQVGRSSLHGRSSKGPGLLRGLSASGVNALEAVAPLLPVPHDSVYLQVGRGWRSCAGQVKLFVAMMDAQQLQSYGVCACQVLGSGQLLVTPEAERSRVSTQCITHRRHAGPCMCADTDTAADSVSTHVYCVLPACLLVSLHRACCCVPRTSWCINLRTLSWCWPALRGVSACCCCRMMH
jgi:hypothetical protein